MEAVNTIFKGDSLSLQYSTDLDDLTGFGCEIEVKDSSGANALTFSILDLSTDKTTFIGELSHAQSDTLNPGQYTIHARIYKDDLSREFKSRLLVRGLV